VSFKPPFCPSTACPSHHQGTPFLYQRKGRYPRKCDGRTVQRFKCLTCGQGFSTQTFRLDYRLHKPQLTVPIFGLLASKVTHRQSARLLSCSRHTVEQRLRLLGPHCRRFHERELERALEQGPLGGRFQLDELETFEGDRRLAPVTMAVLIESSSLFVLSAEAAPMAARGGLCERDRERKEEREKEGGKRRSGSRAIVNRAFELLARATQARKLVHVRTDKKKSYRAALRRIFGGRVLHEDVDSTLPRTRENPLFPINHTLAMMRDGISRLVRRSWGASKKRGRLELHAWVWVAYRNYVRWVTNAAPGTTPAMALGVSAEPWAAVDLLRWRVFPKS
jgi:transposase-like protein